MYIILRPHLGTLPHMACCL